MKRTLSFALALISVISLVACGGGKTETPKETVAENVATETTAEAETTVHTDLPATDWEGRAFRVLGQINETNTQFTNIEITTEEQNGEVFNDAIYARNLALSEQYNVIFEQKLYDKPENEVQKAVTAGDNVCDLAFIRTACMGTQVQAGYYYDMKQVKNIDFSKPYWNAFVNDQVSLLNRQFFASNDYSLMDKNRAYILTYNPDICKNFKLADLADVVKEGKWTVDFATECVETVSGDVNGDGNMTDLDRYGITMDSYTAFAPFAFGCGVNVITKDKDDVPQITMNNEHTVNVCDKVVKLTCDTRTAIFCNDFRGKVDYDYWSVSGKVFNEYANALLTTCFPHSLKTKSKVCEFEYTVIPFPKYDEDQENYISMIDRQWTMLFCIPVCTDTPDFTGFMLEALACASTDTTLHAYYEVCCKSKYSQNEVSSEMLDLIFDGLVFDLDLIFNFGLSNILISDIPAQKESNFASRYASVASSAQGQLDEVVKVLKELE